MHEAEKLNLEQIEAFLKASAEIRLEGCASPKLCAFAESMTWGRTCAAHYDFHMIEDHLDPFRVLVRKHLTKRSDCLLYGGLVHELGKGLPDFSCVL